MDVLTMAVAVAGLVVAVVALGLVMRERGAAGTDHVSTARRLGDERQIAQLVRRLEVREGQVDADLQGAGVAGPPSISRPPPITPPAAPSIPPGTSAFTDQIMPPISSSISPQVTSSMILVQNPRLTMRISHGPAAGRPLKQ